MPDSHAVRCPGCGHAPTPRYRRFRVREWIEEDAFIMVNRDMIRLECQCGTWGNYRNITNQHGRDYYCDGEGGWLLSWRRLSSQYQSWKVNWAVDWSIGPVERSPP